MITIKNLDAVHDILEKGKIEPKKFWGNLGYDIEVIAGVAEINAQLSKMLGRSAADPATMLAVMQVGAALALKGKLPDSGDEQIVI